MKEIRIRSFSGPFSTPYLSVFSPNVGKHGQGKLRIGTLFEQFQVCVIRLHVKMFSNVFEMHTKFAVTPTDGL